MPVFSPRTDLPADVSGPARCFLVRNGDVLLDAGPDGWEIPSAASPDGVAGPTEPAHLIGVLDGQPCWAAGVGADVKAPPGMVFESLRTVHGQVADEVWVAAGRAVQLVEWARTHRFCGRCAAATEVAAGERAMRCPSCGLLAFPRLSPAVIVLITRGDDELLLARGRAFPVPMYSTLAGFVEPGETLEEAVHREVGEEVGVAVSDVSYFASQPWPFPHSLMVGFTARWESGDIVIQESEIVDAKWFRTGDLPMIPPRMSIARHLIDSFLERAR